MMTLFPVRICIFLISSSSSLSRSNLINIGALIILVFLRDISIFILLIHEEQTSEMIEIIWVAHNSWELQIKGMINSLVSFNTI